MNAKIYDYADLKHRRDPRLGLVRVSRPMATFTLRGRVRRLYRKVRRWLTNRGV